MIATVIPGEVPVYQTGQAVARKLLTIARDQGYSTFHVRSFEFGFMVPEEVARVFDGGKSDAPQEGVFFPPPAKEPYWTPERRKAQGERLAEYRRRKATASLAGGS